MFSYQVTFGNTAGLQVKEPTAQYRVLGSSANILSSTASKGDIGKTSRALQDFQKNFANLNQVLTNNAYARGHTISTGDENPQLQSIELSFRNNAEIAKCLENLRYNIGLLDPTAFTRSGLGDWIMEKAEFVTLSSQEKKQVLEWIKYDSSKISSLLNAGAKVEELQNTLEKGDYSHAREMTGAVQQACQEAAKYESDESKKTGLIVLSAQAGALVSNGDWEGAKGKISELELVSVVGVKPENLGGALDYVDNLKNVNQANIGDALGWFYTFDPDKRGWLSDLVVGSIYIVGTAQAFNDMIWNVARTISSKEGEEKDEYLEKAGIAAATFAVSAGFDYLMYRYAKKQGFKGSPLDVAGVMKAIFTMAAKKAAVKEAENIFRDGLIKLDADQCTKLIKGGAIDFTQKQIDAIMQSGGVVGKVGRDTRLLTEPELKANASGIKTTLTVSELAPKLTSDGRILLSSLLDVSTLKSAGSVPLKKSFIKALAETGGVTEPARWFEKPVVFISKLKITKATLDDLVKYGLIEIEPGLLKGKTDSEIVDFLAQYAKKSPAAVKAYFDEAFENLAKIRAWEKEAAHATKAAAKKSIDEKIENLLSKVRPLSIWTLTDGWKSPAGVTPTRDAYLHFVNSLTHGWKSPVDVTSRALADASVVYEKLPTAAKIPAYALTGIGAIPVGATEVSTKAIGTLLLGAGWAVSKTGAGIVSAAKFTYEGPAVFVSGKISTNIAKQVANEKAVKKEKTENKPEPPQVKSIETTQPPFQQEEQSTPVQTNMAAVQAPVSAEVWWASIAAAGSPANISNNGQAMKLYNAINGIENEQYKGQVIAKLRELDSGGIPGHKIKDVLESLSVAFNKDNIGTGADNDTAMLDALGTY